MSSSDKVTIINPRAGTITLPKIPQLKPGANFVDRFDYNEMRKCVSKERLDELEIQIQGDDEKHAEPSTTQGRTVKSAVELVKETLDVGELERFRADEDRKTVLSAIDAQIEELTKEPEVEDEDDEE
jgi:hypothetical protein